MAVRRHVVITGTGRSGTTYLVELLTHLGLETGFRVEDLVAGKDPTAHAGLEHDIRQAGCPFVVKSPWFCDYAGEVLHRDDIRIEHVFVPMRTLHAAAESRRRVELANLARRTWWGRLSKPQAFAGGLWYTRSTRPGQQEAVLLDRIYRLMLAVSDGAAPVTLMRFPRIVRDAPYLFEKLQPILSGVSWASFHSAFAKTARPDLVHRLSTDE